MNGSKFANSEMSRLLLGIITKFLETQMIRMTRQKFFSPRWFGLISIRKECSTDIRIWFPFTYINANLPAVTQRGSSLYMLFLDSTRKWTQSILLLGETLTDDTFFWYRMKVQNTTLRERVPVGTPIERHSTVKGDVKRS